MGALARMWYAEQGSGEPLVLLHGGLGDSRFFDENVGSLSEHFRVLTPDLRSHGRTPDVPGPFTFDAMTEDTIAFIERVVGEPAHLAGHSNGAFIASLIALRRPKLVRPLVLVSGGFHRDGFVSGASEFDVDAAVETSDRLTASLARRRRALPRRGSRSRRSPALQRDHPRVPEQQRHPDGRAGAAGKTQERRT
jgi:pimeloyl-ACP methyl ester carboxylesterase